MTRRTLLWLDPDEGPTALPDPPEEPPLIRAKS